MKKLNINEEFRTLIPPLTQEEYTQLEENLIKEGCRDSLVVWNGTIIDGHNRYKICTEHNIDFSVTEMSFDAEDDVIEWMIRNQLGRRNLTDFQRNEVALKYQGIIAMKMKERMSAGGGDKISDKAKAGTTNWSTPIEPTSQRKELAKIAGTSEGSIQRSKLIIEKGTEEQIERARKGGKGNSVSAISKEIKKLQEPTKKIETKICIVCKKEKPIEEFVKGDTECKKCYRERGSSGLTRAEVRELNELFPDEELEKMYEEMKNPTTKINEENETNDNRNSVATEFEELVENFNKDVKKFLFMPQIKEDEISIKLANETIEILKKIIK